MLEEVLAHARIPVIVEMRGRLFQRVLAGIALEEIGNLVGHAQHVAGFHRLLLLEDHDAALGQGRKFQSGLLGKLQRQGGWR